MQWVCWCSRSSGAGRRAWRSQWCCSGSSPCSRSPWARQTYTWKSHFLTVSIALLTVLTCQSPQCQWPSDSRARAPPSPPPSPRAAPPQWRWGRRWSSCCRSRGSWTRTQSPWRSPRRRPPPRSPGRSHGCRCWWISGSWTGSGSCSSSWDYPRPSFKLQCLCSDGWNIVFHNPFPRSDLIINIGPEIGRWPLISLFIATHS